MNKKYKTAISKTSSGMENSREKSSAKELPNESDFHGWAGGGEEIVAGIAAFHFAINWTLLKMNGQPANAIKMWKKISRAPRRTETKTNKQHRIEWNRIESNGIESTRIE